MRYRRKCDMQPRCLLRHTTESICTLHNIWCTRFQASNVRDLQDVIHCYPPNTLCLESQMALLCSKCTMRSEPCKSMQLHNNIEVGLFLYPFPSTLQHSSCEELKHVPPVCACPTQFHICLILGIESYTLGFG